MEAARPSSIPSAARRIVSAEDTATYDKMEPVVALGKEIDRLEKHPALVMELSRPTRATDGKPVTGTQDKAKTGRASAEL